MRNEWLARWDENFYLLKNVDKDFKKGDSFLKGQVEWVLLNGW
jgi:hypothetical protein